MGKGTFRWVIKSYYEIILWRCGESNPGPKRRPSEHLHS
ncbi:MAG: hypothetical protein IGBAC_1021 [Ignavibacteriae bacterium]|nr:MAG: hypothetical protein IGBAC_1021 [Ignavibacteriota bacterium]